VTIVDGIAPRLVGLPRGGHLTTVSFMAPPSSAQDPPVDASSRSQDREAR